jgi:bifunctional UDP-N-acetylglucosamine pyrophosphorylase/glucosamine-1-phosphate N-acetyltransferase
MHYKDIQGIILAAGKSTRFKTNNSKLLEKICGQEMILFTTKLLKKLNIPSTCVLGFKRDEIKQCIETHHAEPISCVIQEEQKGTGHAISITQSTWNKDHILILNGDAPLVNEQIISDLCEAHFKHNATISFVTAHNPEPSGYGRVIKNNNSIEIVENKHFTGSPQEFCCINAGIYIIERKFLENYISKLSANQTTHELYLTDLVKLASDAGLHVETVHAPFDRIRGVNTLKELWAVEQIKRADIISDLMDQGVRFLAPQANHVDIDVTINPGTIIHPGVQLYGSTVIESNVIIESYSILTNAYVNEKAHIKSHSCIESSSVGKSSIVGPFAYVRNNSIILNDAEIGNFVEVKNSTIGERSKAKHFAYLGDSSLEFNVNIGAGTITCNYDGALKHRTVIKSNAFVGGNNTLVAPITIGENAMTGAGSVITENVPDNALALGRSRQINKPEYAQHIRERKQQAKEKKISLNPQSNIPTANTL